MINILKLRKLQKENANALDNTGAKVEKKDGKQSEDEIVLSINDDKISIPGSMKENEDCPAPEFNVGNENSAIPETSEENGNSEIPEANLGVEENDVHPVVPDAEEPVLSTEETPKDTESLIENDISEEEITSDNEETVEVASENSEIELDPAEQLRLQLIQDLMNDESYNTPRNAEEDKNAEREMLMILMEENKKKREVENAAKLDDISTTENATEQIETSAELIENPIAANSTSITDENPYGVEEAKQEAAVQEKSIDVSANETQNIPESQMQEIQKEEIKSKTVVDKVVHLVEFQLGREFYGVDIIKVREIIKLAVITKVPRAPEFIEGVINLRGSVIPVISLRTKVKMPRKEYDKDSRIIILEMSGFIVGFIVDAVREVLRIPENLLAPPPDLSVGRAEYIMSIAKMENRLVILMDPEKVLTIEESKRLSATAAQK